jgi:hypothetical protein
MRANGPGDSFSGTGGKVHRIGERQGRLRANAAGDASMCPRDHRPQRVETIS